MSIQSGVPFSTTYNAKLGVAGGMNFTKADTEVKDNSVDAGATYSNSKNMIRLENGQQVQYTAYWDNGSGTDPLHPYGLAKTMPTKESDDTIGTFHSGFVSFVAFHKPEQVYIESISSGKFGAVTFKAANLVKDYSIWMGKPLALDPIAEVFTGSNAPNEWLTREYRAPYSLPTEQAV